MNRSKSGALDSLCSYASYKYNISFEIRIILHFNKRTIDYGMISSVLDLPVKFNER